MDDSVDSNGGEGEVGGEAEAFDRFTGEGVLPARWAETRMAMMRTKGWGGQRKRRKVGTEGKKVVESTGEDTYGDQGRRGCGGWEHVQSRIGLRLLWLIQGTAPPGRDGWG